MASYLFGSLNFAIIVLRICGFPDPRTAHSGNAGASNVARVAGQPIAGLVLLLDVARSVSVQLAAARFCPSQWIAWAGLALILGNRFPLYHGFRGGKGVAAYLGFVGAAQPTRLRRMAGHLLAHQDPSPRLHGYAACPGRVVPARFAVHDCVRVRNHAHRCARRGWPLQQLGVLAKAATKRSLTTESTESAKGTERRGRAQRRGWQGGWRVPRVRI